jgi:hypothetical protein
MQFFLETDGKHCPVVSAVALKQMDGPCLSHGHIRGEAIVFEQCGRTGHGVK